MTAASSVLPPAPTQLLASPCTFTTLGRACATTWSAEIAGVSTVVDDRRAAADEVRGCCHSRRPGQSPRASTPPRAASSSHRRLGRGGFVDLHQHLADVGTGEQAVEG